ncbi:MAG: hypothetical protein AB8B93_06010 [Pseudomonadales bacterium]
MPKQITAAQGDTLCGIAVANGFKNCDPLRADAANKAYLQRPLNAGDLITVPDITHKVQPKGAGAKHAFKRLGVPMPSIRIVHGSPDLPYQSDAAQSALNISNFKVDLAGIDGQQPFPAGYGYHADGHADPDSFKVEVEDLGAGATVQVQLQPLKPVYRADGSIERHEAFTGAAAARTLDVECQPVSGALPKVFRSTYLRLTSDEVDQAAIAAQGLLVTDIADGLNGANDQVEILDQQVRASVTVRSCQAAAPNKCIARVDLPVGEDRRRLRMCIHAFRTAPGAAGNVGGVTEQMLRLRTNKWFRRLYAQASIAPKLVGPEVQFVDPPPPDMLVICQDHGRTAAGTAAGGKVSTVAFRLGDSPSAGTGSGLLSRIRQAMDPSVSVKLSAGLTPAQIGAAVVAAMPKGYSGVAHLNARAFDAAQGSCDVMIKRDDGKRVFIYAEATTDTRITLDVARVDLNSVASNHPNAAMIPATIDFRRVLRVGGNVDSRLDCYVVGAFDRVGLRGRAFVAATDLAAAFAPPTDLRYAAIMATTSSSGAVMNGADTMPFTFPHEAGHVLCDAFHADRARNPRPAGPLRDPNGPHELMASGTSPTNVIDGTKRICGGTYTVRYAAFDPAQPTPGAATFQDVDAVSRIRARSAGLLEAW